jgi:hypothetical protein
LNVAFQCKSSYSTQCLKLLPNEIGYSFPLSWNLLQSGKNPFCRIKYSIRVHPLVFGTHPPPFYSDEQFLPRFHPDSRWNFHPGNDSDFSEQNWDAMFETNSISLLNEQKFVEKVNLFLIQIDGTLMVSESEYMILQYFSYLQKTHA